MIPSDGGHSNSGQVAARFSLGDFVLESGAAIREAELTYVTYGSLDQDRRNAVLILPSLMADHHRHDFLIGPGLAFDPEKHFIIASDTFANGQASSPNTSKQQPGPDFPRVSIRDMVRAQHRLVTQHFGIERLLAVGGISMGGMQAYQWAISHPDAMDGVIGAITLGRVSPWVSAVYEGMRKAIMADSAFNAGHYSAPPENGLRAAIDLFLVMSRHWNWYDQTFADRLSDVATWLREQEDGLLERWDANNLIVQTCAEETHDIAQGPDFNGDYVRALNAIRARVLLMPSVTDLLHPPEDSRLAARHIPDAHLVEIPSPIGHLGGGGALAKDTAFMNETIRAFLAELDEQR